MNPQKNTLLTFREAARMLGREPDRPTRVYLWRKVKGGSFPAPVQVSENRIAWRRAEVEAWIASRPIVSYAGMSAGEA